jgi:hypothetical protein
MFMRALLFQFSFTLLNRTSVRHGALRRTSCAQAPRSRRRVWTQTLVGVVHVALVQSLEGRYKTHPLQPLQQLVLRSDGCKGRKEGAGMGFVH